MKTLLRRLLVCFFVLSIVTGFCFPVFAEGNIERARDISGSALVTDHTGFSSIKYLFNNKLWDNGKSKDSARLTLEYAEGIGSLYLQFVYAYGDYQIINNDTGDAYTAGQDRFIHEFVDLVECFGTAPASVTISFENGPAYLTELDVFTKGIVPDSVQKWEHPAEGEIDLILFSTHSDDDQLFFAGLLPYYAVERGYEVLVVYLTDHYNTAPHRVHEVLAGLWAVGVKNYPVIGHHPDFGDTKTVGEAFGKYDRLGHSREKLTGFVVEQLRRFKPMVIVGHDRKGEYGHIQHQVYYQLVVDAAQVAMDPAAYPETAEQYGIWDVPKTYIHLYPENRIVMDWDQPMKNFDGMTPFEVSKNLGFDAHVSQHKGWSWYFEGQKKASQISKYSPCEYGLYRSTVGADSQKNDMFENLTCYSDQKHLAEAEAARLEEERKKQEEAAQTMPAATEPEGDVPAAPDSTQQTVTVPDDRNMMAWFAVEAALLVLLLVIVLTRRRYNRRR